MPLVPQEIPSKSLEVFHGVLPAEQVKYPEKFGGTIALALTDESEELALPFGATGYTNARVLLTGQLASKHCRGAMMVMLPDEVGNVFVAPESSIKDLRVKFNSEIGATTFPTGEADIEELARVLAHKRIRSVGRRLFAACVCFSIDQESHIGHLQFAIGAEPGTGERLDIPLQPNGIALRPAERMHPLLAS